MKGVFSPESPFKKYARSMAILWTLFIFIGCLYPARELPAVEVPFFDKWTHFVLFGGFSFLWLWSLLPLSPQRYLAVSAFAVLLGVTIEGLQALLQFLGRSAELMDAIADAMGAALGTVAFYAIERVKPSR